MTELDNLTRWKDAGHPHIWVWAWAGAWTDDEYAGLLASLRIGPFWPLNEDDIMKTLEAAAKTYLDLKRWHLLGDDVQGRRSAPPASPEDEDVWF
jgi:hypothetical protein